MCLNSSEADKSRTKLKLRAKIAESRPFSERQAAPFSVKVKSALGGVIEEGRGITIAMASNAPAAKAEGWTKKLDICDCD